MMFLFLGVKRGLAGWEQRNGSGPDRGIGLTLVNVVVLLTGWGATGGGLLRGLVGESVHDDWRFWWRVVGRKFCVV